MSRSPLPLSSPCTGRGPRPCPCTAAAAAIRGSKLASSRCSATGTARASSSLPLQACACTPCASTASSARARRGTATGRVLCEQAKPGSGKIYLLRRDSNHSSMRSKWSAFSETVAYIAAKDESTCGAFRGARGAPSKDTKGLRPGTRRRSDVDGNMWYVSYGPRKSWKREHTISKTARQSSQKHASKRRAVAASSTTKPQSVKDVLPASAFANPSRAAGALIHFVESQPNAVLDAVRFGPHSLLRFSGYFRKGDAGEAFRVAAKAARVSTPADLERLMVRYISKPTVAGVV